MDRIKELSIAAIASVFGAVAPIHDILVACMLIFSVNFFTGWITDVIVYRSKFSFKKAFNCIIEAAVISILIAMILIVGDKIDNHNGAMSAISVIVYALIYFYGANIMRNLSALFPKNKLIGFIHYILSFEIIEKIPYLTNYNKYKRNGK